MRREQPDSSNEIPADETCPDLKPEILEYYQETYDESSRLAKGLGRLELVRTQELLKRYLPSPPARVIDIGGGPGIYSAFLLERGYEVQLVDPVPRHVENARQLLEAVGGSIPFAVSVGTAGWLNWGDESFDAVLMMGPLYHIQQRRERLRALAEARRVLKPGGILFGTVITRYAALIGGLAEGLIFDPAFAGIVRPELNNGEFNNRSGNSYYFTTAYFHHPGEPEVELRESGLDFVQSVAIEGPGWAVRDIDEVLDGERRETLLEFLAAIETEPTLLGASPHMAFIAAKRSPG